jgi:hypothetical protein
VRRIIIVQLLGLLLLHLVLLLYGS